MQKIGMITEPVTPDKKGRLKLLDEEKSYVAVSMQADREFKRNELVNVCHIKNDIAYCQRSLIEF